MILRANSKHRIVKIASSGLNKFKPSSTKLIITAKLINTPVTKEASNKLINRVIVPAIKIKKKVILLQELSEKLSGGWIKNITKISKIPQIMVGRILLTILIDILNCPRVKYHLL